ncbi:hypothetical protein HDU98_011321 [Podochytrium sp. JEL0797]|nr:hypothetical protein HDU98_011321 [Podochytrium sp. JEL0797]
MAQSIPPAPSQLYPSALEIQIQDLTHRLITEHETRATTLLQLQHTEHLLTTLQNKHRETEADLSASVKRVRTCVQENQGLQHAVRVAGEEMDSWKEKCARLQTELTDAARKQKREIEVVDDSGFDLVELEQQLSGSVSSLLANAGPNVMEIMQKAVRQERNRARILFLKYQSLQMECQELKRSNRSVSACDFSHASVGGLMSPIVNKGSRRSTASRVNPDSSAVRTLASESADKLTKVTVHLESVIKERAELRRIVAEYQEIIAEHQHMQRMEELSCGGDRMDQLLASGIQNQVRKIEWCEKATQSDDGPVVRKEDANLETEGQTLVDHSTQTHEEHDKIGVAPVDNSACQKHVTNVAKKDLWRWPFGCACTKEPV